MEGLRLRMQKILLHLPFSVLSLASCVLSLNKFDYSHYLVWIDEPFNTNVLQPFYQKIMITYITYTILIHYYIHYLTEKSETRKLRAGNRKLESRYYLSSQFHQVTPFSLFHRPSNVPQTRRRRALSVILTQRNKTEKAYQVMRDIAENR